MWLFRVMLRAAVFASVVRSNHVHSADAYDNTDKDIDDADVLRRPNIILIVMDDLGFNEVPWHHHTDTQLPFLEEFVPANALIVDTFYAMPLCSMTRSALLTGRYPLRYGLQLSVIENGYPFGLSIFEPIMPMDFKNAGYNTYMIGKWHLGFHRQDMTPHNRGFDKFHGSLSPMLHYYTYEYRVDNSPGYNGRDLWMNDRMVRERETDGVYLTDWESDQFLNLMDEIMADDPHNEVPFFMYVAFHSPHDPREATPECLALYANVSCAGRSFEVLQNCANHQIEQAQMSCGDAALRDMITYLRSLDEGRVWDNTLLLWISDNGAPVWDGDNAPLRGGKKQMFEGGVRTPAFFSGGFLNQDRYGQIMDPTTPFHVTDIYPTLLSAAGVTHSTGSLFDGLDLWHAVQYGGENVGEEDEDVGEDVGDDAEISLMRENQFNLATKHVHSFASASSQVQVENAAAVSTQNTREFVYNVDMNSGAYRYGKYKLIWTANEEHDQMYWYDYYSTQPRRNEDGTRNAGYSDYLQCGPIPEHTQSHNRYDENVTLVSAIPCNDQPCLFNLEQDPCEYLDLAQEAKYESLYGYMYNMLMAYHDIQQVPLKQYYYRRIDPFSDPQQMRDGFWRPWMRDYNADDGYTDFEDVMQQYADVNHKTDDVRTSTYFETAQQFQLKWKQQIAQKLNNNNQNKNEDGIAIAPKKRMNGNANANALRAGKQQRVMGDDDGDDDDDDDRGTKSLNAQIASGTQLTQFQTQNDFNYLFFLWIAGIGCCLGAVTIVLCNDVRTRFNFYTKSQSQESKHITSSSLTHNCNECSPLLQ